MRVLVTLAALSTIHAAALAAPTDTAPSMADAAAIEAGVRSHLIDPDSAKFSDLRSVSNQDGTSVVCGTVNARNRLGGYTGKAPFIGVLAKSKDGTSIFVPIGEISASRDEWAIVSTMCAKYGL